jgi:hypothetical protein
MLFICNGSRHINWTVEMIFLPSVPLHFFNYHFLSSTSFLLHYILIYVCSFLSLISPSCSLLYQSIYTAWNRITLNPNNHAKEAIIKFFEPRQLIREHFKLHFTLWQRRCSPTKHRGEGRRNCQRIPNGRKVPQSTLRSTWLLLHPVCTCKGFLILWRRL